MSNFCSKIKRNLFYRINSSWNFKKFSLSFCWFRFMQASMSRWLKCSIIRADIRAQRTGSKPLSSSDDGWLTVTVRDEYTPTVRGGSVLQRHFIMACSMLIGLNRHALCISNAIKSIHGLQNVIPVIFRFISGEVSAERKCFWNVLLHWKSRLWISGEVSLTIFELSCSFPPFSAF